MPLVEAQTAAPNRRWSGAQTAAFRFQKTDKLNIYFNVSHMPLVRRPDGGHKLTLVEAQTAAFRFYKQLKKSIQHPHLNGFLHTPQQINGIFTQAFVNIQHHITNLFICFEVLRQNVDVVFA
jgi:hypothetical protein